MAELNDIVEFLDGYLAIADIADTSWNGLQVEGHPEVGRVLLAVDAGLETFERARAEGADMVIVHHGMFWRGADPSLKGPVRERAGLLLESGISLYACHLPLDRHPEVGNNALLLKMLGARIEGEFYMHEGRNVGWVGRAEPPLPLGRIVETLEAELGARCTVLPFGTDPVRTIAACSGGGGYQGFNEALSLGVDLYLTGDTAEVYHSAKDGRMNVIFAGHHATEIVGVRALAGPLAERFGVEAVFADLPTGL